MPAEGGPAVQVTHKHGGEEAFESFDGKSVYYVKGLVHGIWRTRTQGGEEVEVLQEGERGHWALTGRGIYFFDGSRQPALHFFDFARGEARLFRRLPKETIMAGGDDNSISVSSDDRWIIYTQVDRVGSDLMLVENFR
jgi:hypothetical protein